MRRYRKIAEECLKYALKAREQRHRRAYLDLARKWLDLAENDAKTEMLRAEVDALTRPAN